ncbi:MAG: hypothetical protein KBF78_05735 [Fuscovulum sp.]|jgi:hypothetical protein|nr:hypothetical protein [Fuscovulum sp.]
MPKQHNIRDGDCVASVAFENGFLPETVWNHPENAVLRETRQSGNVLAPGDILHVPDIDPAEAQKPGDKRHRFRRRGVPERLQIRLLDVLERPRAGLGYRLEVAGALHETVTDGDGWVRHPIPPDAAKAVLTLETGEVYEIDLGHLPPHDSIRGVQHRLRNLGHSCGDDPPEAIDEATRSAIAAFLNDPAARDRTWDDAAIRDLGQQLRDAHGS